MSRLLHAWRMLNAPCRDMARLASESLDRDLNRLERLAMRSHQVYCVGCRRYQRQIRLLRDAMRGLAQQIETDAGPALPEDVRARIKQAIADEPSAS